jgi:hypothetical protein
LVANERQQPIPSKKSFASLRFFWVAKEISLYFMTPPERKKSPSAMSVKIVYHPLRRFVD